MVAYPLSHLTKIPRYQHLNSQEAINESVHDYDVNLLVFNIVI